MEERITVDMLTVESVSVERQKVLEVEGTEYSVGAPHRTAYQNTWAGRADLLAEVPEPYYGSIVAVWNQNPPEPEEETEDGAEQDGGQDAEATAEEPAAETEAE